MSKEELVRYIKENRKVPRNFNDYLDYVICVTSLAFIAIGVMPIINYFDKPAEAILLLFSLLLIPSGIWLFFSDIKKLQRNVSFELVEIDRENNFEAILEKIKSNFNLKSIESDSGLGLITAYTKVDWFSWGEKLTLVIEKDYVLLNSRPSNTIQPVTILADRNNIRRMKKLLLNEI